MWKFIGYELRYWFTSPMTWIFLFINTLLVMGAVSSDSITIGDGVGNVHKNAPFVVQNYYGVMSLICLLMTTAFMNATANRDFVYGMDQFIFSSPIKKRDYYFGKFIGAVTFAVLPLIGVSLGSLIGPLMPWADSGRYGDVVWSGHWVGLITFGIPNTIIAASIIYVLAILFRSNIVSFVGAMLILVLYVVSSGFTKDIENEWLATLLDPFGFQPESIMAKYMTVADKNMHGVPLRGTLLYNRIIWVGIGFLILVTAYFKFSFNIKNQDVKKTKKIKNAEEVAGPTTPNLSVMSRAGVFSFRALRYLIWFETKSIVKNPTFIIILLIGLLNLIASLTIVTGKYGAEQYPVTYIVIDTIRSSFYLFLIAVIIFYSGVLVWKERDGRINEIADATPIRTAQVLISKIAAMVITLALILSCTILIGMVTQTMMGYHRYQLDVYAKSLLIMDLLSLSFLVISALFFHYLINNRYIAYFAFVAFLILNQFIWGALRINTNMIKFGSTPNVIYSDMNGFGPFVLSAVWYNIYWVIFCILTGFVIFFFYIRGNEIDFAHRLKDAKHLFFKNKLAIGLCSFVFLLCGSFVYYNTMVLNKYDSEREHENKLVDYENLYKKYSHLLQPRFYKYNYTIDILPYERSVRARIEAWSRNTSDQSISELHFTIPAIPSSVEISIPGCKLILDDKRLGYRIYRLDQPLQASDSLLITFDVIRTTRGFENNVSFTELTQNGTFFNNIDIVPTFGYNDGNEVSDKNKRRKLQLPARLRMPVLNDADLSARANTYIIKDADWVEVNTVISTAPDQIAIAPGSLTRSWEANGKKYFNYKLDKQSFDFYSFISARYEVARKRWNGIDLEVYYIPEHAYNVPNMLKSLEKSLTYYTQNFGKYYHKQCRIIEFPRYRNFAQAFPGTMPYSEGIGFIMDLSKVTTNDIDMVYYVVAHEMAHQYWAHQVCGANMQGSEMMSEGFAQYSALMVMEKEYGKDKMKKFLKYEMDGYLHGRGMEPEAERPLINVEHQPYIQYQKASVVMYYLKEMIGEAKVNEALRTLINSFAYQQPPYPSSLSAIRAMRNVTPDSLQYLITDMFEHMTLFSNRLAEGSYKKVGAKYRVTLKTTSEKFLADSLGKETTILIADYIDIGIFSRNLDKKSLGDALVLKRFKVTQRDNVYEFLVDTEPYQAGIDPYNYLIDRIPDDNLRVLEVNE
ncbi:MAG: M1 family aminopeptidase [Chryseolinea sp.]